MGSGFQDTVQFSNLPYLGMELGKSREVAKVPEVAHILSFYPRGLKLRLFSLYGQWFLRYGPIFKIAIFMHETWQVAKVPEVSHILSFYPIEPKLSLFSLYG